MAEKEKYVVRQFKDGRLEYWVGYLHYIIKDNKPFLVAGGIEIEESLLAITNYLKRKKLI